MCILRRTAFGRKAEPLLINVMLEKNQGQGSPACWPNVPPSRERREEHHPVSGLNSLSISHCHLALVGRNTVNMWRVGRQDGCLDAQPWFCGCCPLGGLEAGASEGTCVEK